MKLSTLVALATVTTVGTTAHTGCATLTCPTVEQPTPTRQVTEVTVQRRIENALKDLEIFNARAFVTDAMLDGRIEHALKDLQGATANALKADQERQNEIAHKAGIDR
jgi:hypothetical protein